MTVPDKTRLTDLLSFADSGVRADTNISFSVFSKNLLTNERISVILYHAVSAAMAQLAEHILGKDEVPGPNPGSSSKKSLVERRGILVYSANHQTPSFERRERNHLKRRSFLSLRDFAYMQNRPSLISLASSKD